jgi:peptidoglycan/xylan/chitin deacetylase (PgdA/CDA1 family)
MAMGRSISKPPSNGKARRQARTVCILYHELERRGDPSPQCEEGYLRYIVKEEEFRCHIEFLQQSGLRVISISESLESASPGGVVITFDDGCETDFSVAAPILKTANFAAIFFIVVGSIGTTGRMTAAQLRELRTLGFEIGCHSRTHPHLTELKERELRREVVESKLELEQVLGARIDHFSCPGGRWNRRIAELAREAGYRSVGTSRIGVNSRASDPYELARIGVMRWTTLTDFERICHGQGLLRSRVRSLVLSGAKTILGNSFYDRVRSGLLDGKRPAG